jgi:hypothetical protein
MPCSVARSFHTCWVLSRLYKEDVHKAGSQFKISISLQWSKSSLQLHVFHNRFVYTKWKFQLAKCTPNTSSYNFLKNACTKVITPKLLQYELCAYKLFEKKLLLNSKFYTSYFLTEGKIYTLVKMATCTLKNCLISLIFMDLLRIKNWNSRNILTWWISASETKIMKSDECSKR